MVHFDIMLNEFKLSFISFCMSQTLCLHKVKANGEAAKHFLNHIERERNKSSSERRSFLQRHKMGLFQLPGFNDVIAPLFWILITEHSLFLCLGSTAHTCHYSVILRWLLQLALSRGGGIKSHSVPHLRSPKHSVCIVVSSCRQQRLVVVNFSHYRHCHYCHHSHKLRHGGHHRPKRCRLKREKGEGECVWWF